MATSDAGASHPATIGRYEVVRLVGRGGMGEVFLARDPVLDREVAVKLIHGDLEGPKSRERLLREARAAARLRHPNIVTIFDTGEHDGRAFIAMEFVRGETLGDLVRGQVPMPLARRLELIEGACAGLAHAHRSGVVHLDIKPDNLMVDESGIVKVLDFGIARVLQSGMLVTQQLGGTLRYMSPEQIEGRRLDHRSDVFSLGCALFEMITFVPAFVGSTKDIVSQISSGPVPGLRAALPELDKRLDDIVRKAMALEPSWRYGTLDELGADLAAVRTHLAPDYDPRVRTVRTGLDDLQTMPASSDLRIQPESSFLRRMSTSRRRSTIAALGFATALLAIALFAMFGRSDRAPAPSREETPTATVVSPAPPPAVPPVDGPQEPVRDIRAPVPDSRDRKPNAASRPATESERPPAAPPVTEAKEPAPAPAPVQPPRPADVAVGDAAAPTVPVAPAPAPATVSPQLRARDDRDGVRETLRRYEAAYRSLDVNGILQVYPTLARDQAEQLRRFFATVTQYEVDIRDPQIDVQADTATVRATLARRIAPRVGNPVVNEVVTEFRLHRQGGAWTIVAVAAR